MRRVDGARYSPDSFGTVPVGQEPLFHLFVLHHGDVDPAPLATVVPGVDTGVEQLVDHPEATETRFSARASSW